MTDQAPGNDAFIALIGMAIAITAAYACGRLQQWYRQTTDREDAFRHGYNLAAQSLFTMAARSVNATKATSRGHVAGAARVVPITAAHTATVPLTAAVEGPSDGRHARTADLSGHMA